jgi:acetyl esterase/lipase
MLAVKGDEGNAQAQDPVERVSSSVNAVACFYPPADFVNWEKDGDSNEGAGPLTRRAAAFGPKGETPEGKVKLGTALSPITWISQRQPPIFIVQGDADPSVPHSQALRFHKRSTEAGAKCEVVIRQGAAHGGWVEMQEDTARMAEWFDTQLLGKLPEKPFMYGITALPSTPSPKKTAPESKQ